MTTNYSFDLKRKLCIEICLNGKSTIKTAKEYNIPLKTLEKWITSFNKDIHCFDSTVQNNDFKTIDSFSPYVSYEDLSKEQLLNQLMNKDIEIARLKKAYLVEEGGMEEKVFISFSKKNTK